MLSSEITDKLKETLAASGLHHQRMMFAFNSLNSLFPLNQNRYEKLTQEQISFTDQLIYRFSKLQDLMGRKVFVLILQGLGEDTDNMPFIDVLNRLEKLEILPDNTNWLELRETRNLVTHEYPLHQDDYISGLNTLYNQCLKLSEIWLTVKNYVEIKFSL